MRGRLDLARSASSPSGGTLKGTQTGTAIAHNCNSMFLFASIAPVPVDPSDVSRFVHTQLKSPRMMDPRKRREAWIALRKRIREYITPRRRWSPAYRPHAAVVPNRPLRQAVGGLHGSRQPVLRGRAHGRPVRSSGNGCLVAHGPTRCPR